MSLECGESAVLGHDVGGVVVVEWDQRVKSDRLLLYNR
jgi:hypothetical protein